MSKMIGGMIFVIEVEPPGECELCGAFEELRPYGPDGANICYACGEKDPEGTEAHLLERLRKASIILRRAEQED